jgi:hypothetical protein
MQLRSQHKPDRDRMLPLYIMQFFFAIVRRPVITGDTESALRRLARGKSFDANPNRRCCVFGIAKRLQQRDGRNTALR